MIYFTSDQHFGHKNIVRLCNRPFKDVEEMDRVLTDNWNAIVKPDDIVYVVGDFAYKMGKRLSSYVQPLNGHKHLILGNHDRLPRVEYEQQFESVHEYLKIETHGQLIVMFHYPILSWDKRARGSWHLYGHVHTAGQLWQLEKMKAWNICVDVNDFKPISFDQLSEIMTTRNVETKEN